MIKTFVAVLAMVLMLVGVSWADRAIPEDPLNLRNMMAGMDIRSSDVNIPVGLGTGEGDYFHLNVHVFLYNNEGNVVNPNLTDLSQVKGVIAYHEPSGREYVLYKIEACGQWLGQSPVHQYNLMLRPEDRFFSGTWTIEMIYMDGYSQKRVQKLSKTMEPTAGKPGRITGAKVIKNSGQIIASWNAIGAPLSPAPMLPNFVYRVRLYDQSVDLGCAVEQLTNGEFDPMTNKVRFVIPSEYSGKPIRLETLINSSGNSHRACYTTMAP